MPVVVADLPSALPAVLAGVFGLPERSGVGSSPTGPPARVVYVMQDGGAPPAWFSRTCATLKDAGWLAAAVTTGQSFGGARGPVHVQTRRPAPRHGRGPDIPGVRPA